FFFSSRRRHTRFSRDWSSDVCSSDLISTGYWNARKMPSRARSSGSISSRLRPWYQISPPVTSYSSRPASTLDKVLLPEPFGPIKIGRASCRERVYVDEVDADVTNERG